MKFYHNHKNRETKNDLTEIVFIIDRSGSMSGFEADTVGGFNAAIEEQKRKGEGRVLVTTVLFDTRVTLLHDRLPLERVAPLTLQDYRVGGCTALYDAVGMTIDRIGSLHKHLGASNRPGRTVFLITTDGMENASRMYGGKRVRELIERQKTRYGWEFLFLAANIDATEAAKDIGIAPDRAASYCQTGAGVRRTYAAMSRAVCAMREGVSMDECDWRDALDEQD